MSCSHVWGYLAADPFRNVVVPSTRRAARGERPPGDVTPF